MLLHIVKQLLLLLLSCFSRVRRCATPWTAAHQAPPSMGFSRQEYCSGVPLPSACKATILQLKVDLKIEFNLGGVMAFQA